MWLAMNDYRKAMPEKGSDSDFSDALIVRKAKLKARELKQKFGGLFTFNIAAQKLPGAKAPL